METNDPQEIDGEQGSDDRTDLEALVESFPDDPAPSGNDSAADREEPFILQNTDYSPDSIEETVRKSGLAWSAGVVFFASIAFMLFLGWIADLLLGSSPWGLVGGIVLGSVIGFIQFFRISSQIFGKSDSKSSPQTLFDNRDDDR